MASVTSHLTRLYIARPKDVNFSLLFAKIIYFLGHMQAYDKKIQNVRYKNRLVVIGNRQTRVHVLLKQNRQKIA